MDGLAACLAAWGLGGVAALYGLAGHDENVCIGDWAIHCCLLALRPCG